MALHDKPLDRLRQAPRALAKDELDRIATASATALRRISAARWSGPAELAGAPAPEPERWQPALRRVGAPEPLAPIEPDCIGFHDASDAGGIDRRRLPRYALALPSTLVITGESRAVQAINIGAQGLRLAGAIPGNLPLGAQGVVRIGHLGPAPVEVRNLAPHQAGLAFLPDANREFRAMLAGLLLRLAAEQDLFASQVAHLASELADGVERALAFRAVSEKAVFGAPGRTSWHGLSFLMEGLRLKLSQARAAHPRALYAVMIGPGGRLIAQDETRALSPSCQFACGAPLFDAQHDEEHAGEQGLCQPRTPLVESRRRDFAGRPGVDVLEASAPVYVRGRLWGCVVIGYRCEGANLVTSEAGAEPSPA